VTKFAAFEKIAELAFARLDRSTLSDAAQTGVNLGCGLLAGFAAAIVSQPADTMLSKINKTNGLPGEGTVSRLVKIAGELGFRGSFAGLPTRLFMVGGLTAGQFAIYGDIKKALGEDFPCSCARLCPLELTISVGATGGIEIAK
jgi:solute carrier family 25 phosphate transporter 3